MIIDLGRCIGCNACTVTCKQAHGTPPLTFWCQVRASEEGAYPHAYKKLLPTLCMHCANPTCVHVCPTGASYKREDGIVLVDSQRCIGCRYCMAACPFEARSFDFGEREGYFAGQGLSAYEDVVLDDFTKGTVSKCKFCADKIDAGGTTACVQACPTHARIFGDLESDEMQALVKRGAYQARPDMRTDPSVYYLPK
jgi:molybdopterin-containing oxidoreductase family iron-sulfur binding subunit